MGAQQVSSGHPYLAANTAHKLIDGLLVVYAVNTELLFDESTKLGVGNSELVINLLINDALLQKLAETLAKLALYDGSSARHCVGDAVKLGELLQGNPLDARK